MSLRLGPFQPQPLLSNEKEICVSILSAVTFTKAGSSNSVFYSAFCFVSRE